MRRIVTPNEFVDFWAKSDHPWALFVGAGISHGEPSRLPLSSEVKSYLVQVLSDASTLPFESRHHAATQTLVNAGKRLLESQNFYESLDGIPLEAILGAIQKFLGHKSVNIARDLIMPQFGETQAFNACHEAMAILMNTGRVRLVFTTNYDCLLETALNGQGIKYELVVNREAFAAWTDKRRLLGSSLPVIFKLHGDGKSRPIGENEQEEIVVTAQDIGRGLPENKHRVLSESLRNFNFVFLGYAGRDWDIEPVLYERFLESSDLQRNHYWVTHSLGEGDLPPARFGVKCLPSDLEGNTNILIEMLDERRSELTKEPIAVENKRLNMQGIDRFAGSLELQSRLLALAGVYLHTGLGQYAGELISAAEQVAALSPRNRLYRGISLVQDNLWGPAKPLLQGMLKESSLPLGMQATVCHNLAFCFQQEGRVRLARTSYQRSLSLFKKASTNQKQAQYDPGEEAGAKVGYAAFLILQGEKQRKTKKGRGLLMKAIKILDDVEISGLRVEPRFFADVGIEKGAAYQALNHNTAAIDALKPAVEIAEQWKYRQQASVGYFKLCTAYYLQLGHWHLLDPFAILFNSDWRVSRTKFYEHARSARDPELLVEGLSLWIPPFLNILGPPFYWFLKARFSKWAKRFLPSLGHIIPNLLSRIQKFLVQSQKPPRE